MQFCHCKYITNCYFHIKFDDFNIGKNTQQRVIWQQKKHGTCHNNKQNGTLKKKQKKKKKKRKKKKAF